MKGKIQSVGRQLALCALLMASIAVQGAARAESRAAISMQDALGLKLPTLADLTWLKSSSQLLASWQEPESENATLEVWEVASGRRHTLAKGKFASVSPDEAWLVYLDGRQWRLRSLRDGKTTAVGQAAPFDPTVFSPPQWSRDSRYFAVVDMLRPPAAPFSVEPEVQDGVRVLDVGRVAEGAAQAGKDVPRITLFDLRSIDKPRSISIEDDYVYYGAWGAGQEYYFVAMQSYWAGKRARTVLRRLDTDTLQAKDVYRVEDGFMQAAKPEVSPDGRWIALALDVDLGKWDDYVSLVLIDATHGNLKRLTTQYYLSGGGYRWAPDSKSIYFTARRGGLSQIHRVSLNGEVQPIAQTEVLHSDLSLSSDGRWLAYRTADGYARRDIRVRATASGVEKVVAITSDPGARFQLGRFKLVQFPTHDGLKLFGYVFLPARFDSTKKYPLYVDVHGGGPASPLLLEAPLGIALAGTPLEWHAWTALGYVVFVPDMRSSGEYGARLAEKRYTTRTWDHSGMQDDAADVESGTRWMIEQGYIDPKRVALFGHSAGGGRVNLLLTRSTLYGAGIIHDPVPAGALPNLISALSGRHAGNRFDETHLTNGIKLADDPSIFTGGFLFDGYKSRTPTLIMVGNPDKGAIEPLSSEILFSVLRQYEVPTRLLRYMDDGHNPQTVNSAMHRFREIRKWLEAYIPASPTVSN